MVSKPLRLAAATMLGVLVIGCSSGNGDGPTASPDESEPSPVRTVKPGQHGPIAKGEYEVEGALELKDDYSVLYSFADESCAKIAGDDADSYVVPLPTFSGKRQLTWIAAIREYGGPGTYELEDLQMVNLEVKDGSETVAYGSVEGATAKLIVDKDNKGTFEFDGLESEDGDKVSGQASWTCEKASL